MDINETQQHLASLLQKIRHPRIGAVLGLQEEVGELCKCIMETEIYGNNDLSHLGEECADVLFSLIDICNAYNINLAAVSAAKLKDIESKVPEWESKYGDAIKKRREVLDQQ